MGQEINESRFKKADFQRFNQRLREETALLAEMLGDHALAETRETVGFELEAWLVDHNCFPAPINEQYLAALDSPLVVPELARFNVELNGTPQPLTGAALRHLETELDDTWSRCRRVAHGMDAELVMIGILPTVREQELILENMSGMTRFRALNEQVMRLRQGRPLRLEIHGRQRLSTEHRDVMPESAATSFQIHMQVPLSKAVRYYNLAVAVSGPMVAASANSPFLFGRDLWDETRIPLFEQAVAVGGHADAAFGPMRRVTFGTGFVRDSLLECFQENLEHYPVLLPIAFDDEPREFSHLRLHNGTIWRWNRPLIGFDAAGNPHLRVEHRVVPAGPSVVDAIANAALFFGLATHYVNEDNPPEGLLRFSEARDNFYAAARHGLQAQFVWAGKRVAATTLLLHELLPRARSGLQRMGVTQGDIDDYLGVMQARLESARNGASWQRDFVARRGADMHALVVEYLSHQNSGLPVHQWPGTE